VWFKPKNSTDQKLAERLKSERLKSGIIITAIEDGVVLVDGQGVIQLFNPGASHITGWDSKEAEGLDWRLVFKLVDAKGQPLADADTAIAKVLQHGQAFHDNAANLVTKSKKTLAVSFSVSPLVEANQLTGAIAIFRDVSEERQEESRRADFISTASHEMRTPVAAIEGYLSLALNEKVATIDNRARGYLEKAHSSTQHLGQLFQDLLTSAKAEDGRLTNHPKVIEIGSYLEQLTSDLRFSAEKKGLFMEFTVGASSQVVDATKKVVRPLYYVWADPDRLREVITNLFDNAVKYTDTGKVTIGLTGNEQVVQLYIRDTGPGIPAEDIPHLFQKFYRVDNSATRTIGGTGLGLFICKKIIELCQGRIWVESALGKGSTFFINLPRITAQEVEKRQAAESQNPTTSVTPA